MNPRVKFFIYLTFLHLLLGGICAYVFREQKAWFLAVEVGLMLSFLAGVAIFNQLTRPGRLIRLGMNALRDQDFQTLLRDGKSPEVNELSEVYNQLLENIRNERQAIQSQHFFLDKLIDASPSGILLLDYDGLVTYFNPAARRLMQLPDSLMGQPLEKIAHPLAGYIHTLQPGESEVFTLNGNAQYKCHAAHFIHRGFPRKFIVVEELTRELLENEKKAYGKVIRMMAHEVNNTVGSINSILQSTLDMGREAEALRWDLIRPSLEIAVARNRSMNQFMQNFSRVIRVPAPNLQWVSVQDMLRKTGKLIESDAAARQVNICYDLPAETVRMHLDPDLMEQALLNMALNALESIGQQGEIRLMASENPPFFAVMDNGPGIPAEVANRIFTPFFSTKAQGQGIGLTLIREILTLHGLPFSLETRPDGWTVFRVG